MSVEATEQTITNQQVKLVNGFSRETDTSTLGRESAYLVKFFGEGGRRVRHLEKGQRLFRMGEDATNIYHLLSGWIKVDTISENYGDILITELPRAGDTFGLEALSGGLYSAEAEALINCQVLSIPAEKIYAFMLANPTTTPYFLRLVAEAQMRADRRLEMLKNGSARSNVAATLFDFAGKGSIVACTQETIAQRSGRVRETANKALKELTEKEIVQVTSHGGNGNSCEVIILNRPRLQAQADMALTPQIRELFAYRALKDLELREFEDVEERRWLHTFAQGGMTLGKSIKLSRLERRLSQSALGKNADLTKEQIGYYERDEETPEENLGKVIKGLGIAERSKFAQFLYLKRAKRGPLSVAALQTITTGSLMRYVRILNNLNEAQLGEKFGLTQQDVSDIETDKRTLPETALPGYIVWLAETSGPALAQAARLREEQPHEQISNTPLQDILGEGLLFAEHIEGNQTLTIDSDLLSELKDEESSSAMLQLVMKKNGVKQMEVIRRAGLSRNMLTNLMDKILEDRNIVHILLVLGYDIHDQITQLLIEQAERDRLKRKDFGTSA